MKHDLISQLLHEPLIVIDAGGRGGFRLFPAFHKHMLVHSFEPDKSSIAGIQEFAAANSFASFSIHENALSDKNGDAAFYRTMHPSMSSLLEPDPEAYQRSYNAVPDHEKWMKNMLTREKVQVKTETLDSFSKQQHIPRIDLLKIDTQGAELKILNGSRALLDQKKIGLIFCEVLLITTYKEHPVFSEIDIFMRSKGYHFVDLRVYPDVLEKENRASFSSKLKEQPKYAAGGDAVYIPGFDSGSDKNFVKRVALLLSGLGYYSESRHLLESFCAMSEHEAENFQRACAKGNAVNRLGRFLKRWTPPAIANLFSGIRK